MLPTSWGIYEIGWNPFWGSTEFLVGNLGIRYPPILNPSKGMWIPFPLLPNNSYRK